MKNSHAVSRIRLLITPSWISGFISITGALIIVAGALWIAFASSNRLNQDIFAVHSVANGVASSYQNVATNLSNYKIANELFFIAFWAGVGIVAYIFVAQLIKALSAAVDIEQEYHYVNAQRRSLLTEAILRLGIRLGALLVWLLIIILTFHKVLPLDLASARDLIQHFSLNALLKIVAVFVLIVIDFSTQTICLRLLYLRPRMSTTII